MVNENWYDDTSGNAVTFIYLLLKYQGWIFNKEWRLWRKIAHGTYGIFTLSLLMAPVVVFLIRLPKLSEIKDPDSLFFAIAGAPPFFLTSCCVLAFIFSEKKIKDFNSTLKDTEKMILKYASSTVIKEYNLRNRWSKIMVKWIVFSTIVLCFGWALCPVLILTFSSTATYENTITCLSDFNYGLNKTSHYWPIFTFEFTSFILVVINYSLGFSLPLIFCILIKGHMHILIQSIERNHFNRFDEAKTFRIDVSCIKMKTFENASRHDSVQKLNILRSYTMHHQCIFRLLMKMRSVVPVFFLINLAHFPATAANEVVLITMEMAVLRKIMFLLTSLWLMASSATFIWFLKDLQTTNSRIRFLFYSIYMSTQQREVRKECLNFMLLTQKSVKFPCIITSSLSFDLFYKTLQLIWNYFTLCQRIASKLM